MIRRARRTVFALLMAGLSAAGCVGGGVPPPDADHVSFNSRDAVFLDELAAGGSLAANADQPISGLLTLPARDGDARVPAVVILHTSSGPSALEWGMASMLNGAGIAALVVDSFGPRGVQRSGQDQTRVTEATMMADAFSALAFLAKDSRIHSERIAVMGFSKGAAVALYAAIASVAQTLSGAAGPTFAAHVVYYPWCGLSLARPRTTGAPIQIHMGEEDNLMSPALCQGWVAATQHADPGARIDLLLYPGARHAFNHPILAYMMPLTMSAQNPGTCRIVETAPGVFREQSNDRPLDHRNYREVVRGCLGYGGLVGYDGAAAALADSRSIDFLKATLLAP